MRSITNNNTTVVEKTVIEIDIGLLEQIKTNEDVEGQIVVHCAYFAQNAYDKIRIWPTTILAAADNSAVSELQHVEGLRPFPLWTSMYANETKHFTLIFSRLPRSVDQFHFLELIPEDGAFEVNDLKRNKQDVYHIKLN